MQTGTVETCRTCGAKLSREIEWCGQCYTPVGRGRRGDELIVLPDADRAALRLRVPVGEALGFTALVIAYGVAAYAGLRQVLNPVGSLPWAASVLLLGLLGAFALVGLVIAWRPAPAEPRERVVVVGGEPVRRGREMEARPTGTD